MAIKMSCKPQKKSKFINTGPKEEWEMVDALERILRTLGKNIGNLIDPDEDYEDEDLINIYVKKMKSLGYQVAFYPPRIDTGFAIFFLKETKFTEFLNYIAYDPDFGYNPTDINDLKEPLNKLVIEEMWKIKKIDYSLPAIPIHF